MPTGYTADVASGKVTDFATFALRCARAFGALVTMRDEPSDATIPDRFEPSDFHVKAFAEAETDLARLRGLTVDQKAVASAAHNAEALAAWERREAERVATKARYEAMLAQVDAWSPPTPDHSGMQKFMREQLRSSIDFDCGNPSPRPDKLSRSEWYEKAVERAEWAVAYHKEKHADDVVRAASRTAWIAALRKSLAKV